MNFDWIASPVTQYAAMGLGLIGCLFLFGSTKAELQAVRRLAKETGELVDAGVNNLSVELEAVRQGVRELEAAPASVAIAEGMNLTKRAQALRMHRRGEPVASIAAALRTPQNEVELLLKIQRLMNTEKTPASARPLISE